MGMFSTSAGLTCLAYSSFVYRFTISITAEGLENTMVVGPRQEAALFANRDKFDLVAIYDSSSSSLGSDMTPMSVLWRLIWEQAFKKMLKRMPMLLVGGIEAWKKAIGEHQIVRSPNYAKAVEIQKPVALPPPNDYSTGVNNVYGRSPFVNGPGNLRSSMSNGTSSVVGYDSTITKNGVSLEQSGHARSVLYIDYVVFTMNVIRSPADAVYSGSHVSVPNGQLARRPAIARPNSNSISFSKSVNESVSISGHYFLYLPNSLCLLRLLPSFQFHSRLQMGMEPSRLSHILSFLLAYLLPYLAQVQPSSHLVYRYKHNSQLLQDTMTLHLRLKHLSIHLSRHLGNAATTWINHKKHF